MFRLVWFVFGVIFRLKVVLLSMAAGAAVAGGLHARGQSRSWGLLPGDAERSCPATISWSGPELVETRSLIIAAAPAQVWPWLVQMGFERGGWYSFAPLDRAWSPGGGAPRHSAETILPQFQDLAVGDIVPTHPGGGFVASVVEPGAALVLYLDDVMVREQAQGQAGGPSRRPTRGRPTTWTCRPSESAGPSSWRRSPTAGRASWSASAWTSS